MIPDAGLNKSAAILAAAVTKGEWGTGTNLPAAGDTDLQTPVAATLLDLETPTVSGSGIQFEHNLSSGLGNGSTLTEFALKFSDGTILTRSLGGPIIKTSAYTVNVITQFNILRQ